MNGKNHFINGNWIEGSGPKFFSINPATGETLWQGNEATLQEADHAVYAARKAFESWSERDLAGRMEVLLNFRKQLEENKTLLAETIAKEAGKPLWEALTEVAAMINKIAISETAFVKRCAETENKVGVETHATRFRPHGVVAVFGPYNFPCHLANGHIVPALIAGNTVVFKPSELTPLTAELTVELWEKAGVPKGVLNLVQGGKSTGQALAGHPGLDGLFFTGSSQTGLVLSKLFSERPDKILALEMGGNNPLVVWNAADRKAVTCAVLMSSFLTAGQRCTCARRLIVEQGATGDALIADIVTATQKLRVGAYSENPEPFMGPVIRPKVALDILAEQKRLIENGANPLLEAKLVKEGTGLLTPGILDVTHLKSRGDEEVFGPLLKVTRVASFQEAIDEANNTRYGLSAGLISDDRSLYKTFTQKIRAGIVNFNRQLTGASSSAPFGGIGLSGNHRPSAYFAADYCSYPVASIEAEKIELPATLPQGMVL